MRAPREQVRIVLPDALRERIEPIRRRFDPERAARSPAHVTLLYHDEATDAGLLRRRLRAAAGETPPFVVRVGGVACFGRPSGGLYVEVEDTEAGFARLRARLLRPPFSARGRVFPHVTLVHPNAGARGQEAFEALRGMRFDAAFAVEAVELVDSAAAEGAVLERIALGGARRPASGLPRP